MGFIIVIIISMLLFDLCECVLWKSIHTLVPFVHFLVVVTVAIADAVRVLDQLNSTLCVQCARTFIVLFVYYMGTEYTTIHLLMNQNAVDMNSIVVHTKNSEKNIEKDRGKKRSFANKITAAICDKCYARFNTRSQYFVVSQLSPFQNAMSNEHST